MSADLWPEIRRHARTLLDIALPAMCPTCGERLRLTDQGLCDSCWERIREVSAPLCPQCGAGDWIAGRKCKGCLKTDIFYGRARQAVQWEEPLISAVHRLKYNGVAELAEPLARLLARTLRRDHPDWSADLIVPVPLHRVRERERGYNQAALIARQLGRMLAWPTDAHAVQRHRWTPSQTHLTRAERLKNVFGAFRCPQPDLVAGRRVLLVDDVYTTGSTINETARALREAEATEVFALTVTRASS
jgi:ComF family protein